MPRDDDHADVELSPVNSPFLRPSRSRAGSTGALSNDPGHEIYDQPFLRTSRAPSISASSVGHGSNEFAPEIHTQPYESYENYQQDFQQQKHFGGQEDEQLRQEIKPAKNNHDHSALIIQLIFPWLGTLAFTVALIVLVEVYQKDGIISHAQKNAFNTISTGLILLLGLSFYEAFKALAKAIRYRLQEWFHAPAETAHLIEGFDSLLLVIQLCFSKISLGFRLFCVFWIFINVAAQIVAAIISLTYSLDDGNDYNGIYTQRGTVKVSNLSCYMHANTCPVHEVQTAALAHAYGEETLAADSQDPSDCGYFADTQSIIGSRRDFRYYCRRNTTIQEFGFRFNEFNPYDIQQVYPFFTNRAFTASSEVCKEYDQVGLPEKAVVGDPNSINYVSAMNFTYSDNVTTGNILIPTSSLGLEGTTYIYRGVQRPPDTTMAANGARGLLMWAYRNAGKDQGPLFYECPVSVSTVTNVKEPVHNITDDVAREAVASIALQGQFHGPIGAEDYTQWQWYASGHPWEIHYHDNSRVGANIAEHAIVSLTQMVARNQAIYIPGTLPQLGTKLNVKWFYFGPILGGVVAVDFLVVALSYWAIKTGPYRRLE